MTAVSPTAAQRAAAAPARSPATRRVWVGIVLLLGVQALLGIDSARKLTVTHDEYWHLPVGLLNLQTGRFDFDNLNPPLVRMWAALPLLATSTKTGPTDADLDATAQGAAFLRANAEQYVLYFALGRAMIVLLTAAAGFVLAWWANELWGAGGALLAALLWAACPNVLAHGALVTTDMGAAAFFVFTLYAAWKHAERPSWKRALLWGVVLGMAQLAKYTCVLLFPLSLACWLIRRFRNAELPPQTFLKSCAQAVAVCVVALAVWNAGYLFRGSGTALGDYKFQSETLAGLSDRFSALHAVPVPLPRDYVEGLDRQKRVMEGAHPVYLDGEWRTTSFPGYYAKTLLYKLPHALQLLALCAVLFLVSPGAVDRKWRAQLVVVVPAAVMLAAAAAGGMQLGIRYVLPALPFLVLFCAQVARWWNWKVFPGRTAVIAVLMLAAPFSLRFHPHHIAYFNELADGPLGGRAHLLDSNLDWGQDLRGLKEWMDRNNVPEIGLAYFGTVPPDALGIRYRIPPRAPQPGWYAVSANFVQGRPHAVRDETGALRPVNIGEFAYFGAFEPAARIGYSIDVYHLTDADVLRWQAEMRRALSR